MALADQLTRALVRAGIPVWGVSIGVDGDRATWLIHYREEATAQQRADGDAMRLTFNPANDPAHLTERAEAQAVEAVKATCALALEVKLGRTLTTGDIPQVLAMFERWKTYFKFIVNNNL